MVNLCIPTILEAMNVNCYDLSGQLFINNLSECNEVAVCLAGFARTCTEEPLFKAIAKNLKIPCLLFDYAGFGASRGNYQSLSVVNATKNFIDVCHGLKKMGFEKIFPIAHSFGATVLASYVSIEAKQSVFEKIVLLAPALNQPRLMRYWFTGSKYPGTNIDTYLIYKDFFERAGGEEGFIKWCQKPKVLKGKVFSEEYWESEKNNDYSGYLANTNSLWIHGKSDRTVPLGMAKTETSGKAVFLEDCNHDFTGCYDTVTHEINSFLAE